MARRSDPETQVSIGWPILPHGLQVTVSVKLSQLENFTQHLLTWAKDNEAVWKTLPVCGPDVVPGGTPIHAGDDDEWEVRRRRLGF